MKKIRIGKDIAISWHILTKGEAVSLEGRDLTLHLIDPLNRKMQIPFTVEDVLLEAKISGTTQKFLGKYSLTLWENYGKPGQTAVDACNAFELVKTTCMEGGADEGLDTETVDLGTSSIEIITAGGEVGTNDYNNLQNKPSINNVELDGNKTLDELGIQPKGEYLTQEQVSEQLEGFATKDDIPDVSGFATKEEIPDVSGLATKKELQEKEDKVSVESVQENTKELQPNRYYEFGEMTELTITLAAEEEGKLSEYMFEFQSGDTPTTLNLPESVKYIGDSTIEANKTYQVSIVNNLAVIGGV